MKYRLKLFFTNFLSIWYAQLLNPLKNVWQSHSGLLLIFRTQPRTPKKSFFPADFNFFLQNFCTFTFVKELF